MTHQEWSAKYARMTAIAERIGRMRADRGFSLAASVGISRDMCCLSNASLDDGLKGWCYRNPHRLKVAKAARHIVDSQFDGYRIVEQWCQRVKG